MCVEKPQSKAVVRSISEASSRRVATPREMCKEICYPPRMSVGWTWSVQPLGWLDGSHPDFNGDVRVFERGGTWCAQVDVRRQGILERAHFSEGHPDQGEAVMMAELAAATALAVRGAPTDHGNGHA